MELIKVLIESSNGHDESLVPKNELHSKVADELKKDKWATLERADGSTEILTKKDLPIIEEELSEEDKALQEEIAGKKDDSWKNAFGTTTSKSVLPASKPGKPSSPSKPSEVWESKFEKVTSATVTNKARGG